MRGVGERQGEAGLLNNFGEVYFELGEKDQALSYFNQALPIYQAVGDRNGEARTLNNFGAVYNSLGDRQKALSYFNQSLSILQAAGDKGREATALDNIGALYDNLGQKENALKCYSQAMALRLQVRDRVGVAASLVNLGASAYKFGDSKTALDFFGKALPLTREVGDRRREAAVLGDTAFVERQLGDLVEARHQIEVAVAIIEKLRGEYTNKQLASSYFSTVQGYYKFYIDLLMRMHKQQPSAGFDGEALQVSERARARALLDTLVEAGADIRQGLDPSLLERERGLEQRLAAVESAQTALLAREHAQDEEKAVKTQIDSLIVQQQDVEAQIRTASPRYAALTQPQPLTLSDTQHQVLDDDTLLLDYSLGEDRSYLWAVTPISISSYELPKREEIEEAARQVYLLFRSANRWSDQMRGVGLAVSETEQSDKAKPAASSSSDALLRLSRMLLSPIASQLGKKRLVIVADGVLQFIPFSALPNPGAEDQSRAYQPLILDHELVSLPSASTLAVLRREVRDRQPAAKWLAVLADPVFDTGDERLRRTTKTSSVDAGPDRGLGLVKQRVTKAAKESGLLLNGLSIPRLPGTRREADAIIGLVPPGEGKEALGLEASREMVIGGGLSGYRYVHFATHGLLDSEQPELSGLVLSMVDKDGQPRDGFLRSHEIFNLKLSAEMVVLSACGTGLGKDVSGEGVVGLTRGFMYAGAPRVVVSLWSVNDAATAELMTRFYRGILTEKLRPAEALQAAQISMLKEPRYSAPFYWAAFTVQGEWKPTTQATVQDLKLNGKPDDLGTLRDQKQARDQAAIDAQAQTESRTVLAPGNPPLTQGMIDHCLAVWEFILDIKLDQDQRRRWVRATIEYWNRDDRKQIGTFLENLRLYDTPDDVKKIRDTGRQGVVDSLRADTTTEGFCKPTSCPDSVILLEGYEAAHPDHKVARVTAGIADLVGTWKAIDFLNADKNPLTGRPLGVSFTDSKTLEISSDGHFKYLWVHSHCDNGSCCHQTASSREGTISMEGVNLVFQMAPGYDLYKDDCNHSLDENLRTKAAKASYPAQIGPSNGKVYLCWDEPGQKKICLEKQ